MGNKARKKQETHKELPHIFFHFKKFLYYIFIFKLDFIRPHIIALLSSIAISVFHLEWIEHLHLIKLLVCLGINILSCYFLSICLIFSLFLFTFPTLLWTELFNNLFCFHYWLLAIAFFLFFILVVALGLTINILTQQSNLFFIVTGSKHLITFVAQVV